MKAKSQALKPTPAATAPPQPAVITHKEIRAESFVLVDGTGRERAELKIINDSLGNDDAVLLMRDAEGHLRLTLRGGANEATVNVFGEGADDEAIEVVVVGWNTGVQTPGVKTYQRDRLERVTDLAKADEDEDDGDDAAAEVWDFSQPFVFDPEEEAEPGELVLVQHGQQLAIEPYGDQQQYLGTITKSETWDLTKEVEDDEDDDELPPLDIEEALRDIRRFINSPVNARLEGEGAWPHDLTLEQMLHQCGYLMHAILSHPDAPEEVRAGFVGLLGTLRTNLAEKDAERLAAIDAGVLFAPVVLELSHLQQLPQ